MFLNINLDTVTLEIKEGWRVRGKHKLFASQVDRLKITRNDKGVIVTITGFERSGKPFAYSTSNQRRGLGYQVK